MSRLTDMQANEVWKKRYEAEVRSFYFADLAAKYVRRKQIMAGVSFFFSSGAAATVLGKLPTWIPVILAVVSAIATAYSLAVSLDSCIANLTKSHWQWNQIFEEYDSLWNHQADDDAEERLAKIWRLAREASANATQLPYDPDRMDKWEQVVIARLSPAV
jgi:hypothetical protein